MADLKDTQLKAEIDNIMDRVARIMEKVGSLGLDQKDATANEEGSGKVCCSKG